MGVKQFLQDSGDDLVSAVRAAARANMRRVTRRRRPAAGAATQAHRRRHARRPGRQHPRHGQTTDRVVAIGTSTGGTQALEAVLTRLPNVGSGIVIVQHMPEKFTAMFAERLNSLCKLEVREARTATASCPAAR
jgi:two-component system chemotaxis response regulator CheB